MIERTLGKAGTLRRQRNEFAYAVFIPIIGLFLLVRVIPLMITVLLSFTNLNLARISQTTVVFLKNYLRLSQDPNFLVAIKNTGEFVVIAVPAVLIFGFLFALLVNQNVRFEGVFQIFYFMPFILPTASTAIIWRWIYNPGQVGLANRLLESLELPHVGWLTNPKIAILSIIVMHVWKNVGFYMVIFLVGLREIPHELRDAAAVDGAGFWQTVIHIEIPLLKPLFLFASVYACIVATSVFTEVFVMTEGSDVAAGVNIPVVALAIYKEGFLYFKLGYAATISTVLLVASLLIVYLQFRLFSRE
jgi:multiple sugar transport system permease protein